jgi:hypothetical protein
VLFSLLHLSIVTQFTHINLCLSAQRAEGKANGELCGSWYYSSMHPDHRDRRRLTPLWRAVIEVAFIVFLFYSNLLMGEFTATNGPGKSLAFALNDIFTCTNFVIAIISALIGYVVFEYLRKKL